MDLINSEKEENTEERAEQVKREEREKKIKQLNMVICICKGIKLKSILPGLKGSETVEDVNKKVGSGSGGCKGERCGPRINALLKKKKSQTST